MVNLHNLHKIKIPTIQVRLLAVMLIGVLFTSVAFAGGGQDWWVQDYGQYSERTCQPVITASDYGSPDSTDWLHPVDDDFLGESSVLDSDEPIPHCVTTKMILYVSSLDGDFENQDIRRWRYSCLDCEPGYHLRSHTMLSTDAIDCLVTWEECYPDSCEGLVCENMGQWGTYDETSSNHNVTRCDYMTGKCKFKCADGYYDKGVAIMAGNPVICAACPPNAEDCDGLFDESPDVHCKSGYYLKSEGNMINGYTKTCPACPGFNGEEARSDFRATSITQCYIPSYKNFRDDIGEYEFAEDCYYTTNSGAAN